MKILFTFENLSSLERTNYIINWLKYNNFDVTVCCHKFNNDSPKYIQNRTFVSILSKIDNFDEYDMWIYDVYDDNNISDKSLYISELLKFKNTLILLSSDDCHEILFSRLDEEGFILNKSKYYLGNVWVKDRRKYYYINRNQMHKFRLLPMFFETSVHIDEKNIIPYNLKKRKIDYKGSLTGHIPISDFRINTILKAITLSNDIIDIKITGYSNDPINKYYYNIVLPDYLKSDRLCFNEYISYLNNSKISLCPKGNSVSFTYRFYESLRCNNLVFSNKIFEDYDIYNPPVENYHYVQYNYDCSDLIQKLNYFINNTFEAESIANRGSSYWNQNYNINCDGSIPYLLKDHLEELLFK